LRCLYRINHQAIPFWRIKNVIIKYRLGLLAVSLAVLPVAFALAQANATTGTTTTTPAHHGDAGASATRSSLAPSESVADNVADAHPNTPGATGDAKVLGDKSTVRGGRRGTMEQRSGSD
jgi:hypothetical protein